MHLFYRYQVFFLILFLILLQAVLILNSRLLPFQDLPNHLAEATIYKYSHQGDPVLTQYYQVVPWYYPNTFYLIFCNFFPSVELGNKIFYIIVVGSLPLIIYFIIKELKGNTWYGLLAILFSYNYNVSYGFSGFSIAIPTLFILFYVLLRELREDKIVWRIAVSLLLILIFLMQAQMSLFALTLFSCLMVFRYWDNFKTLISRLLLAVPLIAMIFIWWLTRTNKKEENTLVFLWKYFKSSYFQNFFLRFRIVFFDNFQLFEGQTGLAVATLFFVCILVPLIIHRVWRSRSLEMLNPVEMMYLGLFFLICFVCFLFLPGYLPGEQIIYQRFSPVLLLSFIIIGSILLREKGSPWLKYFSIFLACIYSVLWMEYIYEFNKENRSFNPSFFAGISRQTIMGGLIYDNKYRGRPVYIQYPSYFIIWKRGIATSKIIDYRFGVIKRGIKGNLIPYYEEWPEEIVKVPTDYNAMDYLLVKGEAAVKPDQNLLHYQLFRKEGNWKMFKNERTKR